MIEPNGGGRKSGIVRRQSGIVRAWVRAIGRNRIATQMLRDSEAKSPQIELKFRLSICSRASAPDLGARGLVID
jgi:hypothetical protein